jgi:hypothetical protein
MMRQPTPGKTILLFSGTLADSTGVFESTALAKALHQLDPSIYLTIIGYCAKEETYRKLMETIEGCSFIDLIGGNVLVPHNQILKAISHANFGLIYYPLSTHIENSMPTKLYEYLGCQLPIILHAFLPWVEVCRPFEASININFLEPNPADLLEKIKATSFYKTIPQNIVWESEEKKLLDTITNLLPSI